MESLLTPPDHLKGLSTLVERRAASLPETIAATLQSVATQLGVQASFLLVHDRQQAALTIAAAYHADGAQVIPTGTQLPFAEQAPEVAPLLVPLVIAELRANAVAVPLLADPIFASYGSYISVPIRFADGVVGGFLGGVAGTAHPFAVAHLEVLIVLARHLGAALEHDREQAARQDIATQLENTRANLRAAHGEMARMEQFKRDFVTIVSHEFRTALTGIQGFSEIVRDEECTIDETKEYAADINADARRLNRLIADMLDLQRMEAGKVTLTAGRVNLNTLICDIVTRFCPTAPRHQIQMQLDPSVPTIPGDESKLDQLLTQLLNNAVKFSPGGGTITVSTRRLGDEVQVSVQDTGIGIPTAELEHIFERYARVEVGGSRYIQGTGLGLAIAREVAQLHGGKVWAESVLDQGATFYVTIPIAAAKVR